MIHEQRAKTIFGLTGALVMLPMVVHAQATELQTLDSIEGVVSYEVQPDGSVRVTLSNGQTVLVTEGAVTVAADGTLLVSELAAAELTAASEVAFGLGGTEMGISAGGAAALGGGLLVAAAAGGGGGGGAPSISKSISVVDAPLENALVFYDSNGDGIAQESEYLGLTDANGAVNVEYSPVPGGTFIILPSPGPDGEADYGWSSAFADQFDDIQTVDVVTGNLFGNILELTDDGEEGDVVASPLSTLVAAGGMTEAQVKAAFGIDPDIDLNSFNFYAALTSDDPDVQAAAKNAAAAAVVANQIVSSAVAAASAGGALTAAEAQTVMAKAVADAALVLQSLPAGTTMAEAAAAATAVAVAGALNPSISTSTMATSITGAMAGGASASDAVATEVAAQQTAGALSTNAGSAVTSTSSSAGTNAGTVNDLFQNGDPTSSTFAQQLDQAVDAGAQGAQEAINEGLLGVELVKDTNAITEGSVTYVKGNVLVNDGFTDGNALPSTTGIYAINGTLVSGVEATPGSNYFVLSSSDWDTFSGSQTVSRGVIAAELGLDASDFPATYPTGGSATAGSAITTSITVEAGDTLTFDYTFMSYDYVPYTDFSFFGLHATDGGTTEEQDGFINELFGVDELKGTSWYNLAGVPISANGTFTYTFTEAGTFDMVIGVIDALDTIVDSYLWVSDVTINEGDLDASVVGDWDVLGNAAQTEEIDSSVVATVVTGYYGTLVITKSGDYIYQAGGPNAEPIPEGVVVTDDFTYTIELEDGSLASQTLSIQVTGTADPVEGVPTIQLTVNDVNGTNVAAVAIAGTTTNVDEGEEVEILVSDGQGGTLTGTATVDADGNFSTTMDLSSLDDTAELTFTASYDNGTTEVSTSADVTKDTTADAGGDLMVTFVSQEFDGDTPTATFEVSGLDSDANIVITLSDGTTVSQSVTATANGMLTVDLTDFAPGALLSADFAVADQSGNSLVGDLDDVEVMTVYNVGTGTGYTSLAEAIADAAEGDTLQLSATTFDEDVVLDKSLTLLGVNAGTAAFTDAASMDPEGRETESVITGTVTVAADDVVLNGLKLDNFDEPLTWDESILDTTPGGLDGFQLLNSVITTYAAAGSPSFNANSDAGRGLYNGETVASGWVISGNLIGGVVTSIDSYGGAMYLSGLAESDISGNMFWRPGGGHLYLSSLTDTTVDGNFFYHGVHADGVDFDGFADMFENDGYGYGYGYGYGGGAAAEDFFGRNFWIELKGTNEGVSFTDNDGAYNSGGIQLYGENPGYSFVGITISGNNFADFINADPNGVLDGAAYYQSGFIGAISISMAEGSTAENIAIFDNAISAAVDQIFSARDQSALIAVQGYVDGLTVSENTLTWTTSSPEILAALNALGVPASSYGGAVSGLLLAGGISGEALINANDFNGIDGVLPDGSPAIYIVGEAPGFGSFMAEITESGNDYGDWSDLIDVYLSNISEAIDAGDIDFEATQVYLGVDMNDDGAPDISYRLIGMGSENDDTFSGTSANELFFLGEGSDTANLGAGGNDLVLIDADSDGGDTITGFTLGEPGVGGDTFMLVNIDQEALRGSGEYFQMVESGDTVGADTGLLIFSNALGTPLSTALDSLVGLNEGDEFYVLADLGADVRLINVTVTDTGYTQSEMVEFDGLSAASFASGSEFNIGNFAEMELPTV